MIYIYIMGIMAYRGEFHLPLVMIMSIFRQTKRIVPGVLESASMMKPIVQRPHRFGCRSCASTSNMPGLGAGAQRWMMLDEGNGQNWEES